MRKREEIADTSLKYVKSVQDKEGLRVAKRKVVSTYLEGVYYAKMSLALLVVTTLITTIGTVQYFTMERETYYTTDYQGEVRLLNPYTISPR